MVKRPCAKFSLSHIAFSIVFQQPAPQRVSHSGSGLTHTCTICFADRSFGGGRGGGEAWEAIEHPYGVP